MDPTRPIYVVELANVIVFALGIFALVSSIRLYFASRRFADSAKDWAKTAKLWARCARAMREDTKDRERGILAIRADLERQYGVKAVRLPAQRGPN